MMLHCFFVRALAYAAAAFAYCSCLSLDNANLQDLSSALDSGCLTSTELVREYLQRIAATNDQLHAILETNPDALAIASRLDAERAAGHVRGPLHGIPILLKDNIATQDRMNTTAGSFALLGATVPRDNSVVARLRRAGAVLLAKANLGEWAQFRSYNSTNGWSAVGGQTYGPFAKGMDPYGSSSGSAVGVAAGMAPAALGTETHGSIVMPASRAGLVGIKPGVGLTSRDLVVPISRYQDTVGPVARTVRDAAVVLEAIAGVDERDEFTAANPNGGHVPAYADAATRLTSWKGVRIGVPRNGIDSALLSTPVNESYILHEFESALGILRDLGAEIVDPVDFGSEMRKAYSEATHEGITVRAGFVSDIAAYFAQLASNPHNIHTLEDLRNFTQRDPREGYPSRDTAGWDDALALGFNGSDPRVKAAWKESIRLDEEEGVSGLIAKHNLSALVMPTEYVPTWTSSPGLPVITVPLGVYPPGTPLINGSRGLVAVAPGIPFGLAWAGKRWSEETLIALVGGYERAVSSIVE
ncbi:amidase [Apiospora arundinis]|uniref:Amidase n=1 Tax=Apiospora arundinis TaxID=335852 RepID=A0ABR2I4I5_9PEZI